VTHSSACWTVLTVVTYTAKWQFALLLSEAEKCQLGITISRIKFGVVIWDEVQTCIWPSRCHCHSLSLAPVNPDWCYLPGFYLSGTCSPGWSRTNSRRAVKRLCL